jgi:hypothetical protein
MERGLNVARGKRIWYPGAVYHLMERGVRRHLGVLFPFFRLIYLLNHQAIDRIMLFDEFVEPF